MLATWPPYKFYASINQATTDEMLEDILEGRTPLHPPPEEPLVEGVEEVEVVQD